MFLSRLLKNRNFIFILAFVLGFAIGDIVPWLDYLVIPALAVVMTVSMSQIPVKSFLPLRKAVRPSVAMFLFNYLLFSAICITLSFFLIDDPEIHLGFIIIAAAPAGVAVAPFADMLGGDKTFSLIGVISSHLMAIIIIPVYAYIFIGVDFIQPLKLLILLSELIVAPFILSRIIIRVKADRLVLRWRGPLVNWGLFVVIFTVIALNRDYFFSNPGTIGIVSLIAAVSVMGTGLILELILKKSRGFRLSYILFATVKNGGFAAAVALSLSGERASIPSAIISVFIIIYIIYLSLRSGTFKQKT